jgi:Ca-activated chloride channel homolog
MKAEKKLVQKVYFFLACIVLFFQQFAFSQPKATPKTNTYVLFILDASTSMSLNWENTTKITAAKSLIMAMVDSLKPDGNVEVGLRVYGHQKTEVEDDCFDSKLEVPFSNHSWSDIPAFLASVRPRGTSPIAYSLQQAAHDFPSDKNGRNLIVLLTDGVESCHGDPCAVSQALQQQHVVIRPFIIGLNADTSLNEALRCIGEFYHAVSPTILSQIASKVLEGLLADAGLNIKLMDGTAKPTETDVDLTLYRGSSAYNFYHTLNNRGVPDTLHPDPRFIYKLNIQTTPPISIDSIELNNGGIKILTVPAAQGWLQISLKGPLTNRMLTNKIKCLVQPESGTDKDFLLDVNAKQKVLAGKYSIQVTTLPVTSLEGINVISGSVTNIQVDAPGLLTLNKSPTYIGAIFSLQNHIPEKIYELRENDPNELIGLQPGTYQIILRMKKAHNMTQTIIKTFSIKSGQSLTLNF